MSRRASLSSGPHREGSPVYEDNPHLDTFSEHRPFDDALGPADKTRSSAEENQKPTMYVGSLMEQRHQREISHYKRWLALALRMVTPCLISSAVFFSSPWL